MKRKPRKKTFSKLRAGIKNKYSKYKKRTMAFWNRRRSFRSRRNFRPRFRGRRSYGFNPRIPVVGRFVGRKGNSLLIWAAIIGGGWFLFKEKLGPLFTKLLNKAKEA
jgi:hypothetical protein